MFLDKQLEFDPAGTAVTVSAASTNTLDLSKPRDLGIGDTDLELTVVAGQDFAAAGAATLTIALQSSVDNATWSTLVQSSALAVAKLKAGVELLRLPLPPDQPAATAGRGRYLRLYYTVATGPFTAGQIQAFMALGRDASLSYPAAYSNAAAL